MSRTTRRNFLEHSLYAAMAGLATVATVDEARAETHRNPGRKVGPNDRIRIACIGVHGRGKDHLSAYLGHEDVEVIAICDVDEKSRDAAQAMITAKGKPAAKLVVDIRELLKDNSLDAVSIATPNHWHALAAIWALQAGKDVYVEKPVSHNVSEGRRIVEAARKYKRICQAGMQSRSHKAVQEAMAYLHGGKLGKITLARALCYKPRNSIGLFPDSPVPAGVAYDLWLGPAPQRPFNQNRFHYNWHWNWDYGNGDLGNQGIHQMDIARFGLNKATLPRGVFGLGGRFGYKDQGETPNTELCFYDYGDSQLIFEVRGLKTMGYKDVKIGDILYGTDGYLAFTDNYAKAAAFDNSGNKIQEFSGAGDHFGNFLTAVRSRKVSDQNADIEEGHLSSALCHLGNISYRLGSPQRFDTKLGIFEKNETDSETMERMKAHLAENGISLQDTLYQVGPSLKIDAHRERFIGSPQADALLTRTYRAPFVVPEKV